MSGTIRDYCLSEKRYGMIVSISPYSKYNAEGKPSHFQNFGKEISNFLPRDLQWLIEEDYNIGCQELADQFGKRVFMRYPDCSFTKEPVSMKKYSGSSGRGGGGRHYRYTKPSPIQKIYEPVKKEHYEYTDDKSKYFYENIKDYDNIEITLNPKDNYLLKCEFRKAPNSPCMCCFQNDGRIYELRGSGKKSSRKTKGMKRQRQYDIKELL